MIKGVSRYAVEIDKTNSPFFEKVICFVRPQFTEGNSIDLHREAVRMVNNLSSGVEEAQSGSKHVLKLPPDTAGIGRPSNNKSQHNSGKRDKNNVISQSIKWIPLVLSAGGGAAAALLISAIF